MALLAAYMMCKDNFPSLEKFLETEVFDKAEVSVLNPEKSDVEGFEKYIGTYKNGICVENAAVKFM